MVQLIKAPPPVNFYVPGIAIAGTDKQLDTLRGAFDTLRRNSPTADTLVGIISKYYETNTDKGPLAVVHGPIAVNGCSCSNCARAFSNLYYSEPGEYQPVLVYTPVPFMKDGSEAYMRVPPEIALAHELVHAYHDVQNSYMMRMNRDLEEARTVGLGFFQCSKFTENAIRKDYGLPLRPVY